jgi:hypothetical protein
MNRRKLLQCAGGGAAGLLGAALTSEARPPIFEPSRLNAVWVHGTTVEAEDPGALDGISRRGVGSLFIGRAKPRGRLPETTWFHISIPAPVIINDVRPTLEKVFVFYRTNGAKIKSVHLYDGPKKIKAFDGLDFKGDLGYGIAPENTWALARPVEILFGLGISIGVQFDIGIDKPIPKDILFTAAGADFRLPGKISDAEEMTIHPGTKIVKP